MKKSVIISENQLSLLDVNLEDSVLSNSKNVELKPASNDLKLEEDSRGKTNGVSDQFEDQEDSSEKKVAMLVDGSSFVYRAFYALPQLTDPNRNPVGAVYGFCSSVFFHHGGWSCDGPYHSSHVRLGSGSYLAAGGWRVLWGGTGFYSPVCFREEQGTIAGDDD